MLEELDGKDTTATNEAEKRKALSLKLIPSNRILFDLIASNHNVKIEVQDLCPSEETQSLVVQLKITLIRNSLFCVTT
jgi:hypothetical protein